MISTSTSTIPRTIDLNLRLGGVTCVACTDLIERDLHADKGILSIQASYTLRRAFVTIDANITSSAAIIARIEKLGYHAYAESVDKISDAEIKNNRRELFRLLVALLLLMQSMMFMYPFYTSNEADMGASVANLMRWANLVLTLPMVFYCATPIFKGAWAEVRLRSLGMDTPVTIAIVVAFVASVDATVRGVGHIYYDSITMFVALLLAARYVQFKALNKAAGYLNQVLQHKRLFAERVANFPQSKQTTLVPADELVVNDVVFIASGETVPADAVLIEGATTCSQALITGESQPINKTVGDALLAGAVNIEQAVYARISAARGASQLDAIERLAQQSALHKPASMLMAERAARVFLYGLMVVCAGAAVYWWFFDASQIVPVVVAILIITCPCALALAVPTVLTAASSALARHNVLVVNPQALEKLAKVNAFAFDKTGTLTQDMQTLERVIVMPAALELGFEQNELIQIAATLEAASRHPIALALRKALQTLDLPERMDDVDALELRVGEGVFGTLAGESFRVGKPSFAAQGVVELPIEAVNYSVVAIANEAGVVLVWFMLHDQIRPHGAALVGALQKARCDVLLISGDKADVVQPFAAQLGIASCYADATPADKLRIVSNLQAQGKTVAMTGDGLNDAAVLQQADVAIAMGHGSSLTQMQADLVVRSGDLADIHAAYFISLRVQKLIRQNLAWAVVYNLIAIPLAATGNVTPLIASIGMAVSSLVVVFNALRILRPTKKLG